MKPCSWHLICFGVTMLVALSTNVISVRAAQTGEVSSDAQGQQAVEEAGESLSEWWRFPWYDSTTDSLKPVKMPEPSKDFDFSALRWLAWIALAAILGGLLFYAFLAFARGNPATLLPTKSQRTVTVLDRVEALPFLANRSPENLLDQAQQHYRNGNYSEAIIYLFSHELVELDRRNLLRLGRGKTNREYLGQLRRHQRLQSLVEQTMVTFEDVFFGGRRLGRERYEACWNRLTEFDDLVGRATEMANVKSTAVSVMGGEA